jgi:hypothetical protein
VSVCVGGCVFVWMCVFGCVCVWVFLCVGVSGCGCVLVYVWVCVLGVCVGVYGFVSVCVSVGAVVS